MFNTQPTSPFGTHFEFPTLEQIICVCVDYGSDKCHVYKNAGDNDSEYCVIKFKDNKITPKSLKLLEDIGIEPSDPVTGVDYSNAEWIIYIN